MSCDASDVGDEDPCFCACNRVFQIFRQVTTSVQPGEGAPGDPSARQHLKALCGIGSFDDLNGPSAGGFQRIPQLRPCIPAVSKHAAMTLVRDDSFQHIRRAVPVLNSGAVDHQAHQRSARVGDDMALAPIDPLARIIPADPSIFGRCYAPAIYDPGCWLSFAALGQSGNYCCFPRPWSTPFAHVFRLENTRWTQWSMS